MLHIDIPGAGPLTLEHLVLDFNGTLARDGLLLDGVRERLIRVSSMLPIHVVTGDIHGCAARELEGIDCRLAILPLRDQAIAKRNYVAGLGATGCACIGNGRNDALMLDAAALSIAVMEAEGASPAALMAADVVVRNALDALDLLLRPLRVAATLRP